MANKLWKWLKLANGDKVAFVPPEPTEETLGGVSLEEKTRWSAQADWNQNDPQAKDYIKNRPGGYDIPTTFDVSWDGDMTGKETVQLSEGAYMVKIADEAPPFEELIKVNKANVEMEILYDDGTTKVDSFEETGGLVENTSGKYYYIGQALAGILSDSDNGNCYGTPLSKGLWVFCSID